MDKRNSVFEVRNENTDEVVGALREGMTIDDRDGYIRELFFLYSLQVKIEESRQGKEGSKCKVYHLYVRITLQSYMVIYSNEISCGRMQ